MRARPHRELDVWHKGIDLAVMVNGLVKGFPSAERFGLSNQRTRAAASVPANIAEGNARGTSKDYANFLAITKGSAVEAETYLIIAVKSGYLTQRAAAPALSLIVEISKMLTAMRKGLLTKDD